MKRRSFAELVSEKYIKSHLEDTEIISYLDYRQSGYCSYFFDELSKTNVSGFPFSSDFVNKKGKVYSFMDYEKLSPEEKADCRLRFFYLPNYHELYIGTTGSGKTTGCIEPQIRAIATQKNKPNLFISDPKGELFEHNGKYLKDQGYNLFILNFKNLARSHCWNPLKEMYSKQMELLTIGKNSKTQKCPVKDNLSLMGEKSEFKTTYIEYNGMAFPSQEAFDMYVENEKYLCSSQVSSLVNQICDCIVPANPGANDRTWSDGARGLLYGILLAMLEDAVRPEKNFTEEHMTLKTANDIYNLIKEGSEQPDNSFDDNETRRKMKKFLSDKSTVALTKINSVAETAPSTRKGFLSTFQSQVERWMQGHIYQLTSRTNISLENDEKPWAIFVATRDYDKSDNVIAGLFIDWVYRESLKMIENKRKKGEEPRHVHFLLDEFGNIPKIPDFDNKIATARSRNIWFHMFIQSYDQLDLIYGRETASIIIDNCNQQTFLGSQSTETKERFSRQCGKKTVVSLDGLMNGELDKIVEIPVVPITNLDRINPGEMYTKRIYSPILKCSFIRSYQCANQGIFKDFFNNVAIEQLIPLNLVIPNDRKHSYFPVLTRVEIKRLNDEEKAKHQKPDETVMKAKESEEIVSDATDIASLLESFGKKIKK